MSRGFTLTEVVVALVVLEIGVLGIAGTLHLATVAMNEAEALELAVAHTEGLIDSLVADPRAASGSRPAADLVLRWTVAERELRVVTTRHADTMLVLRTRLPR